jgi:hypothetical protein
MSFFLWRIAARIFCLRQHGTLYFLLIVFAPAGAKTINKSRCNVLPGGM